MSNALCIGYNTVWSVLCESDEHNKRHRQSVVTYLFHDHSPDGDRHPSILLCKLLAVTRATKRTLSIALNPKSKRALERGTNPMNRNTRACLSVRALQTPTTGRDASYKLNVVVEAQSGG